MTKNFQQIRDIEANLSILDAVILESLYEAFENNDQKHIRNITKEINSLINKINR